MSPGDDNEQDLMASGLKYLDTIVSFWKIIPEYGERELLCLGALSGFSLIYTTITCHDSLLKSNNTVICTGSSYFDDIYMNFIIEGKKDFQKDTHFILLIVSNFS